MLRKTILSIYLLLLVCMNSTAAHLQSLLVKDNAGQCSIEFMLSEPASHRVFMLANPKRVVLDLQNTKLATNTKNLSIPNQHIILFRSGYPNPNILRLVFEIPNDMRFSIRPLKPHSGARYALALDISAAVVQNKPLPKKLNPTPISKPRPEPKPEPIKISRKPKVHRDIIVVLDPGHGGHDPGAIGSKHTYEKHVTLAIAQKLKQLIDRQAGMKAILTRSSDVYIGLRERLNIARKHDADIFISIHADAFINKQSQGASVFALSQMGATSEAARWLAEKENYSELGGVDLRGLDDQSGLVRTVLIDLSQTATIASSLHMGEGVLRELNHMTNLHHQKVEQARFMVLKSPDIPSILIETGFISNPQEEKNLSNAGYQMRLTQSIFQGLKKYFHEYPPHGSSMEAGLA